MQNLIIIDDDELVRDGEKWEKYYLFDLRERGFMFEVFNKKPGHLIYTDFNCSEGIFKKIILSLKREGYLHIFDDCCVIFAKKQKIMSYKVIDYVRKLGYNLKNIVKKKRNCFDYSEEFRHFFNIYPKRIGINSKPEAFKEWRNRLSEGHSADEMINAATNYQIFCDKSGKTGTEFVRAAKNFIGKNKLFLESVSYNEEQKIASKIKGVKFSAAKFINRL